MRKEKEIIKPPKQIRWKILNKKRRGLKMKKKDVIAYLAKQLGFSKSDVQRVLEQQDRILELMAELMKEQDIEKLRLGSLILELKKNKAREYVNPKTKEEQEIEEKKVVKVRYKKKAKYGSKKKDK